MDGDHGGCRPGGIRQLLELIEEHPAAFRYDWRTRLGLPIEALFDGRMSWADAWAVTTELARDPSSRIGAALAGWSHPMPREALVLADLYDLQLAANTDKKKRGQAKPYPRPWKTKDSGRRSTRPAVDQATVRAALAARGH